MARRGGAAHAGSGRPRAVPERSGRQVAAGPGRGAALLGFAEPARRGPVASPGPRRGEGPRGEAGSALGGSLWPAPPCPWGGRRAGRRGRLCGGGPVARSGPGRALPAGGRGPAGAPASGPGSGEWRRCEGPHVPLRSAAPRAGPLPRGPAAGAWPGRVGGVCAVPECGRSLRVPSHRQFGVLFSQLTCGC